jgi:hypothetical protein
MYNVRITVALCLELLSKCQLDFCNVCINDGNDFRYYGEHAIAASIVKQESKTIFTRSRTLLRLLLKLDTKFMDNIGVARICRGGVVLSKIPDFHGQFKKKISGHFQRFFSKGGVVCTPRPPAYAYG